MEFKEVSKLISENGMKIKRLPHLSENRSIDLPKMDPCVSSSLLGSYGQYNNPKNGCPPSLPYSFLRRASS
jgi:hypothetical protein